MGPIVGGFITQTIGFKWLFVVTAVLSGLLGVVCIPLLRETYAPVLRRRKYASDLKSVADLEKHSVFVPPAASEKIINKIWLNFSRPVVLLTRSFICFILSVYNSLYVISSPSFCFLISCAACTVS